MIINIVKTKEQAYSCGFAKQGHGPANKTEYKSFEACICNKARSISSFLWWRKRRELCKKNWSPTYFPKATTKAPPNKELLSNFLIKEYYFS
jgi:hypothetical protein